MFYHVKLIDLKVLSLERIVFFLRLEQRGTKPKRLFNGVKVITLPALSGIFYFFNWNAILSKR